MTLLRFSCWVLSTWVVSGQDAPFGENVLPRDPPQVPAVYPPWTAAALAQQQAAALAQQDVAAQPPAIVDQLRAAKWTMLVGDSVILIQFLEMANQIKPSCQKVQDEMVKREAPNPLEYMWNEINEYALVCKKGGKCDFRHLRCMHFNLAHNCPSSEPVQCKFIAQRTCSMDEWRALVDDIDAPDTDYAVTFHWAPISVARKAPDINRFEHDVAMTVQTGLSPLFMERMRYAHGRYGALIMNSCLHSYAAPLMMEEEAFNLRLSRFKEIVSNNLDLFLLPQYGNFTGPVIFQGCPKLNCHAAASTAACGAQQKDLDRVDAMLKNLSTHHASASQVLFYDAHAAQAKLPASIAYPDDRHPCWIRPCSWDRGCQRAIAAEQESMRQAYAVAFAAYEGHNEWYLQHAQAYQELRATAEQDGSRWLKGRPGTLANSVEPLAVQDDVASAEASYHDLIGLQSWVTSEAKLVQSTIALTPQSYSNAEGACPALRNDWSNLLSAHHDLVASARSESRIHEAAPPDSTVLASTTNLRRVGSAPRN